MWFRNSFGGVVPYSKDFLCICEKAGDISVLLLHCLLPSPFISLFHMFLGMFFLVLSCMGLSGLHEHEWLFPFPC